MEKEKTLKLISVVLFVAMLLMVFSWSVEFACSDVFIGLRYSSDKTDRTGSFSSLTPLPCREAHFARDTLCESIVKNNDMYVKSCSTNIFTALEIAVLSTFMIKTAQIIGIRKYRLLI